MRAVWQTQNCEFTAEAWGEILPETEVAMLRCPACGFVFFDPKFSGNEHFYQQLEREGYYTAHRPEFARTTTFAQRHGLRRVLDVGCGSGYFLDQARAAGCETYGLELNRTAAGKTTAKGHRVFSHLLHELHPEETGGGFDLITMFQVLEHVSAPVQVMKDAAKFLNPGGYLVVAVPGSEGVNRLCPWIPYDWPPHHTSRWRLADFKRLAQEAQLKLTSADGDILVGSYLEQLWRAHNQIAPVLGRRPRPGGVPLAKAISFCYRKTGLKFIFPHWGASIYAYFQQD